MRKGLSNPTMSIMLRVTVAALYENSFFLSRLKHDPAFLEIRKKGHVATGQRPPWADRPLAQAAAFARPDFSSLFHSLRRPGGRLHPLQIKEGFVQKNINLFSDSAACR